MHAMGINYLALWAGKQTNPPVSDILPCIKREYSGNANAAK
jgi:hypothetical protein